MFKCSLDIQTNKQTTWKRAQVEPASMPLKNIAKRSFYRAANAIGLFGKIGRHASEEVILQIISSKCMPVLLYGLEACPLNKADINSLDFVINRLFMKIFKTTDINTVKYSQCQFNFRLPSA